MANVQVIQRHTHLAGAPSSSNSSTVGREGKIAKPKFLRAPSEFVLARQALGVGSGLRFLSTTGFAGAVRARAGC